MEQQLYIMNASGTALIDSHTVSAFLLTDKGDNWIVGICTHDSEHMPSTLGRYPSEETARAAFDGMIRDLVGGADIHIMPSAADLIERNKSRERVNGRPARRRGGS